MLSCRYRPNAMLCSDVGMHICYILLVYESDWVFTFFPFFWDFHLSDLFLKLSPFLSFFWDFRISFFLILSSFLSYFFWGFHLSYLFFWAFGQKGPWVSLSHGPIKLFSDFWLNSELIHPVRNKEQKSQTPVLV